MLSSAQCLTHLSSLKFTRSFFGVAALLAFLFQGQWPIFSQWLVFVLGLVMAVAATSLKYNLVYQAHLALWPKLSRRTKEEPVAKDSAELSFACTMDAFFLLTPALLFYLGQWCGLAWTLVLFDSLLMLLAGITGTCVASIMYAVLIKRWLFKK